jgi:hypothetical protein
MCGSRPGGGSKLDEELVVRMRASEQKFEKSLSLHFLGYRAQGDLQQGLGHAA